MRCKKFQGFQIAGPVKDETGYEREEQEFLALQRKMAGRIRKTGVLTEKEVERIVFEGR